MDFCTRNIKRARILSLYSSHDKQCSYYAEHLHVADYLIGLSTPYVDRLCYRYCSDSSTPGQWGNAVWPGIVYCSRMWRIEDIADSKLGKSGSLALRPHARCTDNTRVPRVGPLRQPIYLSTTLPLFYRSPRISHWRLPTESYIITLSLRALTPRRPQFFMEIRKSSPTEHYSRIPFWRLCSHPTSLCFPVKSNPLQYLIASRYLCSHFDIHFIMLLNPLAGPDLTSKRL